MSEQIGVPLAEGTLLEKRYHVRGLLGQGGMSRVYLADATHLGVQVAVKENLQTTPEARTQFEREAQMLARLAHRNIPRVLDRFTDAATGRQYLVMEYVEGEDLAAMIKRVGPLPEATALAWIGQILSAVEYLHGQQPPVIHRDIKPANIKITPQGKAVLVDFGISKFYDPNRGTVTGMPAVTAGYAPPEQYGFKTTQRSDIYALGATLYTMLTGRVPPDAPLRQAGEEVLVPPRRLASVSGQTESTILRALEVENTRRWQSIGELRAALEGRASASGVAGQPKTVFVSPRQHQRSSNVAVLVTVGAVGIGILCILATLVWSTVGARVIALAATATPTPTATFTPTMTRTPTTTPSITPTSTRAPISTPSSVVTLLLKDDFRDKSGRWTDRSSTDATWSYENNEYHIVVNKGNWDAWTSRAGSGIYSDASGGFEDFTLQAEARKVEGGAGEYGLIFRERIDSDSKNDAYFFEIDPNGYYRLAKLVQEEWTTLITWTRSPYIKTGNATNVLKVVAQGTNITIFVNGQQLGSVNDTTFPKGKVGMFVGAFRSETNFHVAFDNFEVGTLP